MATTERTSSERILEACRGLMNDGHLINRRRLADVTRLTIKIVDDHVDRMVENGLMRRVGSGVIELVEQFPADRPISKTRMPDGTVIIEVGDDVLKLTPSEAQKVGADLMGEATVYAQLRGDRDVQDQVSRLMRDAQAMKKRIADQAQQIANILQGAQRGLEF